jgi:hypothetical protein
MQPLIETRLNITARKMLNFGTPELLRLLAAMVATRASLAIMDNPKFPLYPYKRSCPLNPC